MQILMFNLIILFLICMLVFFLIKNVKKNSKLEEKIKLIQRDFDVIQARLSIQDDINVELNKHLFLLVKKLKEKKKVFNNEFGMEKIFIQIEEIIDNMDVINNDFCHVNNVKSNIEQDIKNMIKDIKVEKNVLLDVENNVKTSLKYDVIKFISSLKMIIFLTLNYNSYEKIKLNLSLADDNKTLRVKIKNINLFNDLIDNKKKDILNFFQFSFIEPYIGMNIKPELFIIRNNLLLISKKIYFNNLNELIIDLN